MAKEKSEKRTIDQEVDCDTGRLYGDIDGAIAYLIEMRDRHRGTDISLDEHWTGYEDMEMRFVYSRLETDEEFAQRLEDEERIRRVAEAERTREAQRKRDLDEYKRLGQRLGIR